uniref:Uncharacterized protein n=1 Tax=Cacopsylla melanoneura TaxID=428564 RepID=A0A8D8U2K4_9HEMI
MYCQMDDSRVSLVNWKRENTPNSFRRTNVPSSLIDFYLVILIRYCEDGLIRSFVNVFTYVFYRFNGVAVLNIYMSVKGSAQQRTERYNVAVINADYIPLS